MYASWLLTKEGYADLTDTYDTTVTRKARVANAIEFLNALNKFGKATIIFDCWPQRYPLTPEELYGAFSNTKRDLTYPSGTGYLQAFPLIEISGFHSDTETVITIKNLVITFTAAAAYNAVMIDCETQSIYDKATLGAPPPYTMTGAWEKLGDGDTVSAQITVGGGLKTIRVYTRRFKL